MKRIISKNAIRKGGSTPLLTADTVDIINVAYTADMVYTVEMHYTVDMVYTVDNVYTVNTIDTVRGCS